MSITLSGDLQGAIYGALTGDAALVALVGVEIYDAPLPSGGALPLGEHVTLGEEMVKPFGSATSSGGVHDFDIVVHSTANGFAAAKVVASAVSDVLVDANLNISGGHLVSLRFLKAKAKRGVAPELRRIEMRFRAVVEDI
ncbi:hypothetical protein A9Q96_10225 [Rhodobacterales bacterium 52_120_T64]|nr:hypothetical protein A9Q96_10225 [Rhodobacterales bacterium 52_120_T64]